MSTFGGINGRIKHLRVGDSAYNQPFGPPGDALGTQVVVELQGSDKYFGFEVMPGPHLPSRLAMLAILREAYIGDLTVGLAYLVEDGKKACMIMRVDIAR